MHKFDTNFFILLIGERYMDVDLRDSGIELLRGKNHCTIKKLNYITHQEKICSYQCIPSIPKETEGSRFFGKSFTQELLSLDN